MNTMVGWLAGWTEEAKYGRQGFIGRGDLPSEDQGFAKRLLKHVYKTQILYSYPYHRFRVLVLSYHAEFWEDPVCNTLLNKVFTLLSLAQWWSWYRKCMRCTLNHTTLPYSSPFKLQPLPQDHNIRPSSSLSLPASTPHQLSPELHWSRLWNTHWTGLVHLSLETRLSSSSPMQYSSVETWCDRIWKQRFNTVQFSSVETCCDLSRPDLNCWKHRLGHSSGC